MAESDRNLESNGEPNEMAEEEKQEQTGEDKNSSAEEILKQITECFGDSVAKAFQDQDATQLVVIRDLLERDAESGIFQKLQMTFGQAVRFKVEFAHLLPPRVDVPTTRSKKEETPQKPTMGQLSFLDPAVRRLYLLKRKEVGVLACEHWKNTYPKFNTPEKKGELTKFAEKIAKKCSVPAAGFNKEGIAKHVQDFFNEQRRYKKRKLDEIESKRSASSSPEEDADKDPDLPKFAKRCDSPSSDFLPDTKENDDDGSDDNSVNSTLSVTSETGDIEMQSSQTPNTASEEDITIELTPKVCKTIVKSVCGKILNRDESLKLLKNKFGVTPRNLTSLTPSQLLEVASKKLLRGKYVEIPEGIDASQLKSSMLKVKKEIEL